MNLIDRIVNNTKSQFSREGIRMVRYADDFILIAKQISQGSLAQLHGYLNRMGLIINQEKSKLVNAKETSFDFLGFTFRYDRSILFEGTSFWNIRPRDKSQKRIRQRINEKLKDRTLSPRESSRGTQSHASGLDKLLQNRQNKFNASSTQKTQRLPSQPFNKVL
jgi:RNA-directed DNA polymerase